MTIQDLFNFIEENGGFTTAFKGWAKGQLEHVIAQDKDYKSFHEKDEHGIQWYVLAAPVKAIKNFHVNGIVIRKDLRNRETLNRMLGIFLKFYPGYTITGDRGKNILSRHFYRPEDLRHIQQKHIYGQRT